jgi:hypothetical protein
MLHADATSRMSSNNSLFELVGFVLLSNVQILPYQTQRAHWKAQKRTGDALPKRVAEVIETGKALVTEAKGLGRGR